MDARRAKTTVILPKYCAYLMVPLHTLKNIAEQSLCKEHNGTVPCWPGQGCFPLLFKLLERACQSLLPLARVFCIYLYNTSLNSGCE